MSVKRANGARLELWISIPADLTEPMHQILTAFNARQRSQMIRRDHALPQLLEILAGDNPAELGLTNQEALEGCCIVNLEVRQHSQLFERGFGQVLGFVHNQ